MTRIDTGRAPYQKGQKAAKKPRKKREKLTTEERRYLGCVKLQPCVQCGSTAGLRDAHHCKDLPDFETDDAPYEKSPRKHRRSGTRDTIPLCPNTCHNFGPLSLHMGRASWRERHGPDYSYIPATRAAVNAMLGEIDF